MSIDLRWNLVLLALASATLGVPSDLSAQNRVIINRGAAQVASVRLETDSNVNIDPVSGNVVVSCAPNPVNPAECLDPVGGTGATLPPAFTIAASNFNNTPTNNLYPVLTTFNLGPVGTLSAQYEACQRIQTGTGASTSWFGLVPASQAAVSGVTVSSPNASYNFSLRCFADGGARTSNVVNVLTADGNPAPPGCPANWNGQGWASFAQRLDRRLFTELRRLTGQNVSDFPQLNGLAIFAVARREYISVRFEARVRNDINGDGQLNATDFDSLLKLFTWIESQSGEGGASSLNGTYFSLSKCEGDFRLPPADNIPDPVDPTLNLGCRNIRLTGSVRTLTAAMSYAINAAPSNSACALAYGQTYFLNMMTVNPLDGYQVDEHNCVDTVNPRCGVQFQSQ